MEPTLPDGSAIVVDRNRSRLRVGHIYVVRTDDGLLVKRVERDSAAGGGSLATTPTGTRSPGPAAPSLRRGQVGGKAAVMVVGRGKTLELSGLPPRSGKTQPTPTGGRLLRRFGADFRNARRWPFQQEPASICSRRLGA